MARKPDPERREQYLKAALKLFVEKGVANTSTAAIAREAGSAAGTLFLYFPTKLDLINALILQIAREQAANTISRLSPDLSARESFYTIWDSTVRWFLADMDAFLYTQQVRDSGLITEEVIRETGALYTYYYEAIQKGMAEGSIKPYPIDLIGEFLYHGIMAVMNLVRRQADPAKQDETIQSGFDIFWDGIKRE